MSSERTLCSFRNGRHKHEGFHKTPDDHTFLLRFLYHDVPKPPDEVFASMINSFPDPQFLSFFDLISLYLETFVVFAKKILNYEKGCKVIFSTSKGGSENL